MNKTIKYTGYYKDVFYEINKIFKNQDNDEYYWTYYIFIEIEKIPKKYNPNSFWLTKIKSYYDYNDHEKLNNIYFYSGISYYSKVSGLEEGEKKIIKVGCDFHHLWDVERGLSYSYDDIYAHLNKTIHSLFNEMPEYSNK